MTSHTPSFYWRASVQSDNSQTGAGESLPVPHALPAGVVVRASRSPLRFWPDAQSASAGTLTICDTHGIAAPRAIVLSLSGRPRLADATAGNCR